MTAASRTNRLHSFRMLQQALAVCVVGLLFLSGCGRATYERRLQQTIALGKYRQKLNDNLTLQEWSNKGVSLRVPKQFKQIKDDREENDEGEIPDDVPDPRQPPFMSTPLPGIIGAWQAEVDLLEPDGKAPAYIFVLSNYDMWLNEGQGEEALKFNDSIAPIAVVDGLRAKLPEPEEWKSESHPRSGGYLPTDRLTAALIPARVALPLTPAGSSSGGENGDTGDENQQPRPEVVEMEVECKVYLAEKKDMRVTLVFIVPVKIADAENLSLDTAKKRSSRFAMSLDTLSVSSRKPKKKSKKGGGNSSSGTGIGI